MPLPVEGLPPPCRGMQEVHPVLQSGLRGGMRVIPLPEEG